MTVNTFAGAPHAVAGTTADIGYVESTSSFVVGVSLAQPFNSRIAVGKSLGQPFGVQSGTTAAVGRSLAQPFGITKTVGKSLAEPFGVAGVVAASLAQRFVIESSVIDVIAAARIQRLRVSRDKQRNTDVARAQALLTKASRQHAEAS